MNIYGIVLLSTISRWEEHFVEWKNNVDDAIAVNTET